MSYKTVRVAGNSEIVAESVLAIEALPDLLLAIGEDADIATITIGENMPISVTIGTDVGFDTYEWDLNKWQKVPL